MDEMLKAYLSWYDVTKKALESYSVIGTPKLKELKGLLVTGMGGSGVVGDVIYSLLYGSAGFPVQVVKDFKIPSWVGKGWLVLSISYSGNTLETIETVVDAIEAGAEVSIVSSNGKLIDLAKKLGLPYVTIDKGYAPRAAFPLLLIGAVKVLSKYGIDLITELKEATEVLNSRDAELDADKLMKFIGDSVPIFITNTKYAPLGFRAKNEFNENTKVIAKAEVIPEWGHNDIVGWEGKSVGIKAVVFVDPEDPITKYVPKHLRDFGHEVLELELSKGSYLSNILYWFKVVGIASTKLALSKGLNPKETKSIVKYKSFVKSVIEESVINKLSKLMSK